MTYERKLPCGTKFLRVLIFAIFAVFSTIRKKKFPRKKFSPQKITPLSKKFGNKTMKLQSVHFSLLKSPKKRIVWRYPFINWLTCYTSASFSRAFDCFYSNDENVIIPNRRRLPENRKNSFPVRLTSFSQSQKLVPAKHKKSPIGKIKLPQKFSATW